MSSAPFLVALVLLAACSEVDEAEGVAPAGAHRSTTGPAPAAPPPVAARDPLALAPEAAHAALGDQYLVIVHTGEAGADLPEALLTLARDPTWSESLVRLRSSRFRGLMPCYDIVVAGASVDLQGARARAAELQAAGVEHYVKGAGPYVGPDPRLDALCASRELGTCGDELRFVVHVGEAPHLALQLAPEVAERAIGGATTPPVRLAEDGSVWATPLPVRQVADVSKGDTWTLSSLESERTLSCTVSAFGAVTVGQPHFAWSQAEERPTRPGCGSPEPMARLACPEPTAGEAWMARPGGSSPLAVVPLSDPEAAAVSEADGRLLQQRAEAALAEAGAWAEDQGQPLQVRSTATGGSGTRLLHLELQTGEGESWCGGPDLQQVQSLVLGEGGLRVDLHDTTDREVLALVEVDGEARLVERDWTGSLFLLDGGGTEVCTWERAYCDCPC